MIPIEHKVRECLFVMRPLQASKHTPNLNSPQRAALFAAGVAHRVALDRHAPRVSPTCPNSRRHPRRKNCRPRSFAPSRSSRMRRPSDGATSQASTSASHPPRAAAGTTSSPNPAAQTATSASASGSCKICTSFALFIGIASPRLRRKISRRPLGPLQQRPRFDCYLKSRPETSASSRRPHSNRHDPQKRPRLSLPRALENERLPLHLRSLTPRRHDPATQIADPPH